jgi:hypothetical protein
VADMGPEDRVFGGDWYDGETGSILSVGAGGCSVFNGAREWPLGMWSAFGVDTGGLWFGV